MVRRSLTLFAVAVAIPFGLVACGDDDEDETPAASETSAETTTTEETTGGGSAGGGGETIDISETDFAIDPANPTAQAGEVTFAITNDGDTVHNLGVEGNGVDEVSDDIAAGESTDLTVDLDAGAYKIYCEIPGHEDLGMVGELTVE